MKESYDCDCGICSICNGLRKPGQPHHSPKEHDLKILPCYFEAQVQGFKNFEIRKNDRDFKTGDILNLREIDGGLGKENLYTGRSCTARITYVLSSFPGNGFEGLEDGYSILSTEVLDVFA